MCWLLTLGNRQVSLTFDYSLVVIHSNLAHNMAAFFVFNSFVDFNRLRWSVSSKMIPIFHTKSILTRRLNQNNHNNRIHLFCGLKSIARRNGEKYAKKQINPDKETKFVRRTVIRSHRCVYYSILRQLKYFKSEECLVATQ